MSEGEETIIRKCRSGRGSLAVRPHALYRSLPRLGQVSIPLGFTYLISIYVKIFFCSSNVVLRDFGRKRTTVIAREVCW